MHYVAGGLHLPKLALWLDPHQPCGPGEKAFVSHAHSDHVADHREVILSAPTSRLMRERLPAQRAEHILGFGQSLELEHQGASARLTLLPAGHIFGSSMALLSSGEDSVLYTGDFKLRKSLSSEPCQPHPAQVLVMETTFGRPQYRFPPTDEVLQGILRFCREALDNDETAVLLGYSLGKSQELLCGFHQAGLPVMLHGAVWKMTQLYQEFGHCFPPYERYRPGAARGKVLLCPPSVVNSGMLRNLGRTRTAVLTGWAVDPNCRYRYQCDAAFPLSDHADFSELLEIVRLVNPRRVLTLHGFAADFAETLRQNGYDAHALSETDQLILPLAMPPTGRRRNSATPAASALLTQPAPAATPERFAGFAEACRDVAEMPGKLLKIQRVANYLKTLSGPAIALVATWFSGRPFPASHNKVLQVGWTALRDALCNITGATEDAFHQVYLRHSDLGETASDLLANRRPGHVLTLASASGVFEQLRTARGPLAKIPLLTATLDQCSGLEAKYLVKIISGDLRIGLKEGLVEEAVADAFAQPADAIRNAHLVVGDIGETARLAAENRLGAAGVQPFRPVRFMLASPEPSATAIWERMAASEVWLEDKYDGIRCQLHKAGGKVALYSRDLKEITATFPDLVEAVASAGTGEFILDGEIVAMRGGTVLPFAELQRRLGRREGDLFLSDEVPVRYVAFDLLWQNGRTLLNESLRHRRTLLETALPPVPATRLAWMMGARSPGEIDAAFDSARDRGNEGLMIKDPASAYTPGRRGLAWLKLKKALATLDCVVVGAEYGHGKRSQVLSDYTFAVRDVSSGQLKTIGKAYTGLTDDEIAALTRQLLSRATRQRGRYFEVLPEVVLEIAFDRIQPSQRHASGLALRFPRINRIRHDKSVAEIDTLQHAWELANETK